MPRIAALLVTPVTVLAVAAVGVAPAAARSKGPHRVKAAHKVVRHHLKPHRPATPTTSTPSTPTPPASTPAGPTSSLQDGLRDCANTERAKVGLPALAEDAALDRAAQAHAADMSANDYFDHDSQNGDTPWARIAAALNGAAPFHAMGENIATGYSDAQTTCVGWMNSAGHKANILNPKFKSIGTGWVDGYAVQDFGAR